jgi:acetylornithine deacetylase/succinyl-diaminopimelate desuccinylase-like protein
MPASRKPSATRVGSAVEVPEETLREVIETLAPMERPPGSPGERKAAEWIAARLERAGCDEVVLEDEPAWGTWPPNLTALGALSVLGALLVVLKRRLKGVLISLLALVGFLDEVENGPRLLRRAVRSEKTTVNVVASIGDRSADRTVVVLAHHDAAQTGRIFDQTWAKTLHRLLPDRIERTTFQFPQWWIGVAAPILATLSAVTRWRRPARWALGFAAIGTAAVADIANSPTVPGANDNLSGVAVLVGLAQALEEDPVSGVRVLLVSCGAEETFQEGIRAFMDRHHDELQLSRTYFLNFDTVGSPNLIMLEGEGPIWMEDYTDPAFRDLVERCASENGIRVERGIRARASTDAVIPSRAGYPTAAFISFMPWRMPGNYHLMSDVPENVDYSSVSDSVKLGYAVLGALAAGQPE